MLHTSRRLDVREGTHDREVVFCRGGGRGAARERRHSRIAGDGGDGGMVGVVGSRRGDLGVVCERGAALVEGDGFRVDGGGCLLWWQRHRIKSAGDTVVVEGLFAGLPVVPAEPERETGF